MPGVRFCRSILLESGCPEISLEQVGTSEEERRLAATTFGLLGMLRCFGVLAEHHFQASQGTGDH